MSHGVFRYTHRVTYADCTVGDHIYYGRYLELLEAARGEFFRHLGKTFRHWQDQDALFWVVECHLKYRSPARYDDVLTIEVWITSCAGVRLNFAHRVVNQAQELILEGETWHVCAGLNEKPKRLPPDLVEMLKPYLAPAAR